jgi:hypothetical protein
MLAASETGLAIDPEHVRCNNLRAMALVKLGRKAEAGQTLDAALAREPENAFTHANRGWALLESGEQNTALDHFREALTFDPTMEWSRAGIVESLKSRNFVYRWLLRYFLWIAKLSPRARWMIFVGAFVGQLTLGSYADQHPAAAPFCLPFLYAYIVFALLTWLGQPLFNLLLFSDKLGRRALSRDQRLQSFSVAGVLLIAVGIVLLTQFLGMQEMHSLGYDSAIFFALTSIPTAAIIVCQPGWPRWAMTGATALLGLMALVPLAIWIYFNGWPQIAQSQILNSIARGETPFCKQALDFVRDNFWLGLIGSQFLVMYLARIKPVR